MTKTLLLLDSTDGINNYDSKASDVNNLHPYNLYFPLSSPMLNITKILLKSVEIPISLPNIRSLNTSSIISLTYTIGTVIDKTYSFDIGSGFYTGLVPLLSAINTGFTTLNTTSGSGSPTISFATTTNDLGQTVLNITHNCESIKFNNTVLTNYILRLPLTTNTTSPIKTKYLPTLYPETHLYMYILNLPTKILNNKQASFKIPLSNGYSTSGTTLYYSDSNKHQFITITNNNFLLDKLDIRIVDKFGYNVTGYYHWSFSLIIEYENSTQQEFLNLEY
jgi:hypothetical protein